MPSLPTPGGVGVVAVGDQDHRPPDPAAAQVERLDHHLRVADADVDERDLEPALAADARRGRAGQLPLELDPEVVERGLERRLQLLAADDQHPRAARR